MELVVTQEDLFNNYNIDLCSKLGVKGKANNTTVVNNWLNERQEEIVNYIGSFAYGGNPQAEQYFNFPIDTSVYKSLVKAVMYQCVYSLDNRAASKLGGIMMTGGQINKLTVSERIEAVIAPKAHMDLMNNGLLYTGRCL